LQDATYINSLSTLTITLQPNESMEVRYLGSGGGFTSVFSMQRNLVGLVAIPASTSDFTLYHERRHSLPHAYAGVLNLKLPITYRVGTSITLEDVVGTSASTITAINITPMGSQTVQSLSTVNIKTLIDNGCTVKLVFASPDNWVLNVQYSRVIRGNTLGVRNTAGALTSFDVSAATVNRTITLPNTNLDLGNIAKIPAVATPYTTGAMAGTRPQCLGGSSNTFSGGTDVVAIGCTSSTLSGTNVTYINVTNLAESAITWANAIVLGSAYNTLPGQVGGGLNVLTNTTTINNNGAGTYSAVSAAGAVSSSNCVKLALGLSSSAVHEIDFIIQHNNDYSNVGTITGKRRVIAFSDYTGAITVSSVDTPYADFVMGSSTGLAFSVTLDTTNNRLIPTLTATGVGTIFGVAMQAKVTSYYTKKAA